MRPYFFLMFIPLAVSCQSIGNSDKMDSIPYETKKLKQSLNRSDKALKFCKNNQFDTTYCFFIDMNLHSGRNRFFVWDLQKNEVLDSGLVSHGSCKKAYRDSLIDDSKFSNISESHCSSLGKYRVGSRDYSNWGINVKYWIHGLEPSNDNAVNRVVVLHSWSSVPDYETHPTGSPESWGCPAVSNAFMKRLDKRIQNTDQPILLWIFR